MTQSNEPKSLFYAKIEVASHAIKKNNRKIMFNRRTKRTFIGKSDKLHAAENYLVHAILRAKIVNGPLDTITKDISVRFIFYIPESEYFIKAKKGITRRSKNVPDLSNLYQLPEDCLQKAGVIENDSQIQSHDGSRIVPTKDSRCSLLIDITEFVA